MQDTKVEPIKQDRLCLNCEYGLVRQLGTSTFENVKCLLANEGTTYKVIKCNKFKRSKDA